MVYELQRLDGYIYAYITWVTVRPTDEGDVVDDNGTHIQIMGTWIHPDYRRHNVLSHLMSAVRNHKTTSNATHVFWERSWGKNSGIIDIGKFDRYININ